VLPVQSGLPGRSSRPDRCQRRRRTADVDLGHAQRRGVRFDHAETLAATLRHVTLVEVDTPTHLLWLGEGSDRTAAAILSFIKV
jgi:hypothetical protein